MGKHFKLTIKACYLGYITQAINNNLCPLLFIIFQTDFSISLELLGTLILINFITQLIVDIITVKVINHIGYRPLIVLAHICSFLGLLGLGILPNLMKNPYLGLIISVITYAIGGGLIEVLISPIIESIPSDDKSGSMSLLHSFYCLGQVIVVLLTTLLLAAFGRDKWPYLAALWSLIPFINIFLFLKAPLLSPISEHGQITVKELFKHKEFILFIIIMVCAGASELTMSQWSSLFAETGLGVSKVMGDLLGPCLFAILMGLGRVLHGVYGSKYNLRKLLTILTFFCVLCYLVTVFSSSPMLSLIACGLTGLSVSLMWPGTFSLAASRFPLGGALMFGVLAIFGDLGCAAGPYISGVISSYVSKYQINILAGEDVSLKIGLLFGTVFPLILLICLLVSKTNNNKIKVEV